MHWLLILKLAYVLAQGGDLGTSMLKQHQGCREVGVWPNFPTMYAAKGAALGATLAWGGKYPQFFIPVESIGVASGTYATIHNLHTRCVQR